MDQALKIAKLAALSSLAFLCIALSVAVQDVRHTLRAIQRDVQGVTDKAGVELVTLNASTSAISNQAVATLKDASATARQAKTAIAKLDPALDELPSVVSEAYSVEHNARLSLDNVNKAAIDERMYFERDLPPLMDAIKADVVDAGDTLTAAKDFIADPNLKRILTNSGDMTDSGRKILQDGADETHKLVHPDKKKLGFWGAIWVGAQVVHKLSPPLF